MSGIDDFGRDDGIICECGAKTYLVYDQGGGLRSYECDNPDCDKSTMVQFESSYEEDEEGFYEPPEEGGAEED